MAEKVVVKAEKREGRGKNDSRRLRVQGKLPISIYGGGVEAVAAVVDLKDLAAILRSDSGQNTIFTIDMVGEGTGDVIFHDRQIDALKGRLVHADLRRLAKGEKIEVTVAIHLIGEAVGLKEEGAVLNQQLREIKVLCEPSKIPEFLEVDVTDLNVGESIHVSDMKIGEGIEVHELPESVVVSIVVVKEEELEPQLEAPAEPEIVGKDGEDTEGNES
ncbi:MAG: 50S ribosomal protein L25 [Acidobacteriota bacterium]|nr:50S ribosomal protein L25 [Acidobacteriota bacterium]